MKRVCFLFLAALWVVAGCVPLYAASNGKLTVLLYHHILPEKDLTGDNAFIISEENFRSHMEYLYDNGYSTITLEELKAYLYEEEAIPQKSVLITFDDGYSSNISYAYPILKEYGFTAAIFIITEVLEQDPDNNKHSSEYISTEQMQETSDVFEYASHTHALHKYIDGKSLLVQTDHEGIVADINTSVEWVDNAYTFAYPHGQLNNAVITALKEAGMEIAFATTRGYVSSDSHPFKLNRFCIYRTTSVKQLKEILSNAKS